MPFGGRHAGRLTIAFHQPVERASRDRFTTVAREQNRRSWRRLLTQIGPQRLDLVWLHRMRTGMAALHPVHHDTQGTKIDVVRLQQSDLARTQAMPVGEQEQCSVARARARCGKQPGKFFQGQKPDRVGRRAGHGPGSLDRKATAQNNRFEQFRRPSTRRSLTKLAIERAPILTVMGSLATNAPRLTAHTRSDAPNGGW